MQDADAGDTTTTVDTLIEAADQVAAVDGASGIAEVVGDKGYHSNETMVGFADLGVRSYVSEPDRGRRKWKGKAAAKKAVYANRRRIRGNRGQRLLRQRGERVERPNAHLYETGGMRRVHLRGHPNILKRLLVHVCGFNLGLLMRQLTGVGTPRSLQGRAAALLGALIDLLGGLCERLKRSWAPEAPDAPDSSWGRPATGSITNTRSSIYEEPLLPRAARQGTMGNTGYDIIVIGTGAGGGTIVHALAATSARILILERGDFVPQEPGQLGPRGSMEALPLPHDRVLARRRRPGVPTVHALLRRRQHQVLGQRDVPISAGRLHGGGTPRRSLTSVGPSTTRRWNRSMNGPSASMRCTARAGPIPQKRREGPSPTRPIPHSDEMAETVERLREQGLHPSPLPLGLLKPGEADGCVLCNTCNSFPCLRLAKSEADVCCIRPTMGQANVTLWTNAYARPAPD